MDWEGKGAVSCRIIYNIYAILHGGRFERCLFVALSPVIKLRILSLGGWQKPQSLNCQPNRTIAVLYVLGRFFFL